MLVAQKKRKENIAEYILYLYQIEDLIRAFNLDMDLIKSNIINRYQVDLNTAEEISAWYENLIIMMKKEGRQEKGHLQFLHNLVTDFYDFHLRLLANEVDPSYIAAHQSVKGLLLELRQKNVNAENDVQTALDGIYGYLLLKIQQKEVSPDTVQAMKQLSSWLSILSKHYRDFESGDLQL